MIKSILISLFFLMASSAALTHAQSVYPAGCEFGRDVSQGDVEVTTEDL